jgi:anti-anti-sigma factor
MTSVLPPLPYSVDHVVPCTVARCHAIRLGATAQVTAMGELCMESAGALQEAVARAGVDSAETLVVDLTAVTFADSSAIAALLGVARRAEARHVHLVVLAAPGPVVRLLDLTGVRERLHVVLVPA